MQGVTISTSMMSIDMQCVYLSPDSSMDVQGVFVSIISSMDAHVHVHVQGSPLF
jgi:hypothetical protein